MTLLQSHKQVDCSYCWTVGVFLPVSWTLLLRQLTLAIFMKYIIDNIEHYLMENKL